MTGDEYFLFSDFSDFSNIFEITEKAEARICETAVLLKHERRGKKTHLGSKRRVGVVWAHFRRCCLQ